MTKKYEVSLKGLNFNTNRAIVVCKEIKHSEETTPYEMLWGSSALQVLDVKLDAFEDTDQETMAAIQTAMNLAEQQFEAEKCIIWA